MLGRLARFARALLLFTLRGLLLWAVLPLGVVLWLGSLVRAPRQRPGAVVGWLDGLVTAGLNTVLGRPLGPAFRRPRWGEQRPYRVRSHDLF